MTIQLAYIFGARKAYSTIIIQWWNVNPPFNNQTLFRIFIGMAWLINILNRLQELVLFLVLYMGGYIMWWQIASMTPLSC